VYIPPTEYGLSKGTFCPLDTAALYAAAVVYPAFFNSRALNELSGRAKNSSLYKRLYSVSYPAK